MKFEVRDTLLSRGPIEGQEPERAESLLVGDAAVATWFDNHFPQGHDACALFPAWHEGKRVWLLRQVWSAANGYSAWGTQDAILEFAAGIQLLVERGKWEPIFGRAD